MFERYTEGARRTIFFARYEAYAFGSPYIESEHLLLGLMRVPNAHGIEKISPCAAQIRSDVEGRRSKQPISSMDVPLSKECKRIVSNAAEEADRLGHHHIGTAHLLLGILREQKSFAAELALKYGADVEEVRGAARAAEQTPPRRLAAGAGLDMSPYRAVMSAAAAGFSRGPVVDVEYRTRNGVLALVQSSLLLLPRMGETVDLSALIRRACRAKVRDITYVFQPGEADHITVVRVDVLVSEFEPAAGPGASGLPFEAT